MRFACEYCERLLCRGDRVVTWSVVLVDDPDDPSAMEYAPDESGNTPPLKVAHEGCFRASRGGAGGAGAVASAPAEADGDRGGGPPKVDGHAGPAGDGGFPGEPVLHAAAAVAGVRILAGDGDGGSEGERPGEFVRSDALDFADCDFGD